jgi:pSer/pThr/pTyr-binding forkhead associated (FHA) protein
MDRCPVCNGPIDAHDAVCPHCGYKLTGTTQEFQPVKADGSPSATEAMRMVPPEAAAPTAARLVVVQGPQTGTSIQLERRHMSVGRNPNSDVFLNDMTVSRKHAELDPAGDDYKITDTGSFNGIWVNNQSVETAVLRPGDVIQVGAFVLKYER